MTAPIENPKPRNGKSTVLGFVALALAGVSVESIRQVEDNTTRAIVATVGFLLVALVMLFADRRELREHVVESLRPPKREDEDPQVRIVFKGDDDELD